MILPAERRKTLTAKASEYAAALNRETAQYLLSRGISKEVAQMFQLGYVATGEMAGRLSIPYLTPAGVVQIKYRRMVDDESPKYLYEAGGGLFLFNAQALMRASDIAVITEGELDAVCVQAYCGIPAVAYPGADTWKRQQHWRLCFEGIQEVIVVADGDKVGREAARRVAESIGFGARVVDMPAGQDANSFIAGEGASVFLERIS